MEVRNHVDDICYIETLSKHSLVSRLVNYQPLTSSQVKIKSYPLEQIKNQRVQESLVVRDLLNVLVGLEGVYIRYNNSYQPVLGSQDDLRGPDFRIAKNMDLSLKSFAKWIVKFGKIYVVLTRFSERYSEPLYGSIMHRLCFEIRKFLTHEYVRQIVDTAEMEFQSNPLFSIRELGQLLTQNCAHKAQILYDLVQNIMREMNRRALMDREEADFQNFIQDLKKEKDLTNPFFDHDQISSASFITDSRINIHARGGVILQMIQDKLKSNRGNERNVSFLKKLFDDVSVQYCSMLDSWLTNGSLGDPYEEFMVADTAKSTPRQEAARLNSLNSERLWDTQYVIRKDGLLDDFNNGNIAFKVLMTGKLLNLFRTCCDLQSIVDVLPDDNMKQPLKTLPQGTQLMLYVDQHYARANKLAQILFYNGYNFPRVLKEFHHSFLFCNNPGFFRKFFNRSLVELTKLRSDSVQVKLQRTFQEYQSCREDEHTNVVLPLLNLQLDKHSFYRVIEQFSSETANGKDNADLLQARNFGNLRDLLLQDLDMEETSDASKSKKGELECSIHHLQFEIIVPYPLNTLISKTCVFQYQTIQRYLFLLHYYNKVLQDTWFEINKNKIWRHPGFSKDVHQWIRRCRVVHFRMTQFMKFILEYTTQDVIQSGWSELEPQITNASASEFDFSHCQSALQDLLTQQMSHSLLTNASLVRLLVQITDIVHRFCKFVTSLRKTLCLLDVRLYSYYHGQLPDDKQYDESMALQKLQELQEYLDLVWDSFTQHKNAFAEGVRYYCNHGSIRSGLNPVLSLAERLRDMELEGR
ncbi:LAME_0G07008g1_1 [Lachancea meyersii CBS 8951]|uniref:Spindle pole body component n=1 Tax=Lachancea meyersii CBS 8951 TaxID=1266667 RepID=A0A1G4K7R1_9SACH|nr:LAME_0G07008g1_1 [Lachancea meyersii CBS 8951]